MPASTCIEESLFLSISKPTEPAVLMLRGEQGWSLPQVTSIKDNHKFIPDLNQAVSETYGLDVTLLKALSYQQLPDTKQICAVLAMESHNPEWDPPALSRWVNRCDLRQLELVVPSHRDIIESWLREVEDDSNGTAVSNGPWEKVGWYDEAMSWLRNKLVPLGISLTGTSRQFGITRVHYLVEVQTDRGKYYFKAVGGELAHEQPLTCLLAELFPANIPKILAVDDSRRWWLMQDIGGKRLDEVDDINSWKEALSTLAKLQISSISHLNSLSDTNCPDWRLESITEKLDWFFAKINRLREQFSVEIGDRAWVDIRDLYKRLAELQGQLASYGIPNTLGHGDFNFGNIYVTVDQYVFLDWAEGHIGHPFFTAVNAINYLGQKRPDLKSERARWREAYLKPWSTLFSYDHLHRAYCLARPFAMLRRAMRGLQYLLSDEKPPDESVRLIRLISDYVSLAHRVAHSPRIES